MDYERIIIELGNKIAQLSIDNASLLVRIQEEMTNKENVEQKLVEEMNVSRYYKELYDNVIKTKEESINE